jgi:endonuclease/exonuclease/phosphatase family metal-dependent hydrolase
MRSVLISVFAVFVGAACNHPRPRDLSVEMRRHGPSSFTQQTRLRLVTYNVHMIDGAMIAAALRAKPALAAADLVMLQEVESHPEETESRACIAARQLDLHCAYAPGYGLSNGGSHGIAILSRFPLTDLEITELPYNDTVVNSARRIALGATIDPGAGPVRIYAVHLDNRISPVERVRQLAPVLDAADERDLPTVIAGDMNTSPFLWLGSLIPVPAGTQDDRLESFVRMRGFATPVIDSGATSTWLGMRLDAVYTRRVEVGAHHVESDVRASDHLPLWADLEL